MQALQELPQRLPQDAAVSIGVFDGVHLGHQRLLARLREEARRVGGLSLVLTFRNHPRTVLQPGQPVPLLMPPEERLRRLQAQGVDLVVPLTFDLPFSHLGAREFLALLRERLRLRALVMGPDFALGHRREGSVSVLQHLGRELGFATVVVEPVTLDGRVVSSTAVRQALARGEVGEAARMLGHPFTLEGRVGQGQGRGRALGFPTANLELDPALALPGDGIYATWAEVNGVRWPSATSIGVRPTFSEGQRVVESYLIGFQGNLYGQRLRLAFVCRLREERRFPSPQALAAQIAQDVLQARQALERAYPEEHP